MAEISNRAKQLLDTHQVNGSYDIHIVDELLDGIEAHVNIENSAISSWAITYSGKKTEDIERAAICAGLFFLLEKSNLAYSFDLSFREVENYLRDDGTLTAWESVSHHQKPYRNMLMGIIKGLSSHLLMSSGASMENWEDLSMRSKLEFCTKTANKVSQSLNALNVGKIELVTIEEMEIVLSFEEKLISSKYFDAVLGALSDYFQFSLSSTSIKLVAQ